MNRPRRFSAQPVIGSVAYAVPRSMVADRMGAVQTVTSAGEAASRRTRLLVVGALPPPIHGCSIFTQQLLESRLAAEFDITHLDTSDRRGVANIGRFDAGNAALALQHGMAFVRMLLRVRPDVVYVQVAQNGWGFLRDALFLAPAAFTGRRLVIHFHGDSFGVFRASTPPALRLACDALLRRARCAVVQGSNLVPMLTGAIREDRIRVVPNGVSDAFGGMIDRSGRAGPVRVLYLSNLTPAKGYVDLIRAVVRLLEFGIDAQLDLAGGVMDPVSYAEAQQLSSGYPGRIRFLGVADAARKGALLRDADILVLPSHSEAQPMVILEAMSAALPVVSTRRGAIPETVVDGVTGVLVEPRDIEQLAAALERLVRDAALRTRMGAAGRARFVDHFTADRWADRMISVFRSASNDD